MSDRAEYLKSLVNVLPDLPGVYQYFDSNGTIIYVGKAKSLKKRVSQYFMNKRQSPKTQMLVSRICDIKHIVVNSEEDALLLENNLIKKHQPRYNILLKDDKTYPWIVIRNEPFPRVESTRNLVRDGSVYYGPYPSQVQMKALFDVFKELYPIRTCKLNLSENEIAKGNFKPCLKYHIHNCMAPCCGYISPDEYSEFISDIRNVLRGNVASVIKSYKQKMISLAEDMMFEQANVIKGKIEKLMSYQARSMVSNVSNLNVDVFSYLSDIDREEVYVNYMKVSNGLLVQSFTLEFKLKIDEDEASVLSSAIQEIKSLFKVLAKEIVVPFYPDVEFADIKFTIPTAGDRRKLLELSERNAKMYKLEKLKREANMNRDSREEKLMMTIKESLGLKVLPRHIECFDNSNIQGHAAVAACVVFKDCKPCKDEYRLFNIKTVEGPDDYASMYEVVYRRYTRVVAEGGSLPDLIVADGGVGQMEIIRQVVQDALSLNVPILGLAKDNKHRTNEILFGFPPKVIGIGKNDSMFRFFTRVQDEVHRFAISFHRNKRSKLMTTSELDGIPKVGPKTKEVLLKHFKGIKGIKAATVDELTSVVGAAKAKVIADWFASNRLK